MPSDADPAARSRQVVARPALSSKGGLAVAAKAETVESGIEMLRAGGTAVDAAVAMAFTAAVVEPTEASIGGSGFMLVHSEQEGCQSVEKVIVCRRSGGGSRGWRPNRLRAGLRYRAEKSSPKNRKFRLPIRRAYSATAATR